MNHLASVSSSAESTGFKNLTGTQASEKLNLYIFFNHFNNLLSFDSKINKNKYLINKRTVVLSSVLMLGGSIFLWFLWNRFKTYPSCYSIIDRVARSFEGPFEINAKDSRGNTKLYNACKRENVEEVKALLEYEGVDLNLRRAGWYSTPFRKAYNVGNCEIIELFSKSGKISLHTLEDVLADACREKKLKIIEVLLQNEEIDPNGKSHRWRHSPLQTAVKNGSLEVVRLLLQHKNIDPNFCNDGNWTPLQSACENGNSDIVELLLQHDKIDPNIGSEVKYKPLFLAFRNKHFEIVRILLEDPRIDPNISDPNNRPLLFQIDRKSGGIELMRVLLQNPNTDLNKRDYFDRLPLIEFYKKSFNDNDKDFQLEKFNLIIFDKRIDINKFDGSGRCLFHFACIQGDLNTIKSLFESESLNPNLPEKSGIIWHEGFFGAPPRMERNNKDGFGYTGFHQAALFGHIETVRFLLNEDRVDPSPILETSRGRFSLLNILLFEEKIKKQQNLEVFKLLCESNRVNLEVSDDHFGTPLQYLIFKYVHLRCSFRRNGRWQYGQYEKYLNELVDYCQYLQLLLDNGADPNIRTKEGKTPLCVVAGMLGSHELIAPSKLLLQAGANPNAVDGDGKTAFYQLSSNSSLQQDPHVYLDLISMWLDYEAEADQKYLKRLVRLEYENDNNVLVDKIINISDRLYGGDDCINELLHYATLERNRKLVERLLHVGADPNAVDGDGKTAFQKFISVNESEWGNRSTQFIIDLLPIWLDSEADPNITSDKKSRTLLHIIAPYFNDVNHTLRDRIINANININSVDDLGDTSLHLACKEAKYESVQLLLKQESIDVNIENKQGKTPLYYACVGGDEELIRLLHSCGANSTLVMNDLESFSDTTQQVLHSLTKTKRAF
ncbi:MAG: ankyrin repeat domain-containing protein [Candidatus Algichlamydia australiensis]|nr:ankyrin repeat domain-containing protein [Chlamydiales bacterium]